MTEQPDRFSAEDPEQPDRGGPASARSSVEEGPPDDERGLKNLASLERLRDRVEVTAREMNRLRDENRALAERIQELETRPAVDPHATLLSLDYDPELLKRKISGFIDALDTYLENERNRP